MKFVHIADMHFDSPFSNLSDRTGLGDKMRMEQRRVFKQIIDYIKQNNIGYFFISGDLYEQKYIRKSTIDYINKLFEEIPNTKIFISPGNHDPYIHNSYYNQYNWNKNVKIFSRKTEIVETEEADIYGSGFDDFYCEESRINEFNIKNKDKINILVIHGSLNASETLEKNYNPISKKSLEEKEFDYVALGHIHKRYKEKNIAYPGSTVPLGFDELGKHGMIIGDIEKDNINIDFVNLSEVVFKETEINCTEIISQEELVETLNKINISDKELHKVILIGKRNFEINIYKLFNYNLNKKIIKIKNKTRPNYDLNSLKNDTTLKGLFTNEMIKRMYNANNEEEKTMIEKAIELGLEVLE